NVDAIADAHCALAANGMPAKDVASFRAGSYASVAPGPCGATCPAECGCASASNQCVASWRGGGAANTGGAGPHHGRSDGNDDADVGTADAGVRTDASLPGLGLGQGTADGDSSGCAAAALGGDRGAGGATLVVLGSAAIAIARRRRRARR